MEQGSSRSVLARMVAKGQQSTAAGDFPHDLIVRRPSLNLNVLQRWGGVYQPLPWLLPGKTSARSPRCTWMVMQAQALALLHDVRARGVQRSPQEIITRGRRLLMLHWHGL